MSASEIEECILAPAPVMDPCSSCSFVRLFAHKNGSFSEPNGLSIYALWLQNSHKSHVIAGIHFSFIRLQRPYHVFFDWGVSGKKNVNMDVNTFRTRGRPLQRCFAGFQLSAHTHKHTQIHTDTHTHTHIHTHTHTRTHSSHPSPQWQPFVFHSAKMCSVPSVRKWKECDLLASDPLPVNHPYCETQSTWVRDQFTLEGKLEVEVKISNCCKSLKRRSRHALLETQRFVPLCLKYEVWQTSCFKMFLLSVIDHHMGYWTQIDEFTPQCCA